MLRAQGPSTFLPSAGTVTPSHQHLRACALRRSLPPTLSSFSSYQMPTELSRETLEMLKIRETGKEMNGSCLHRAIMTIPSFIIHGYDTQKLRDKVKISTPHPFLLGLGGNCSIVFLGQVESPHQGEICPVWLISQAGIVPISFETWHIKIVSRDNIKQDQDLCTTIAGTALFHPTGEAQTNM